MKSIYKAMSWFLTGLLCVGIQTERLEAQCSTGCTTTLTSTGGSGDLTLDAGDTLCIRATSGNLEVDYDEVRMRPGSGIKTCSDEEDTVMFNAELRFFTGGSGTHGTIDNSGNFIYTFGSLTYPRTHITNNGYWEVNGSMNQPTTGPPSFTNTLGASIVVNGDFDINNGEFTQNGNMSVTGYLDFNGPDFISSGTNTIGGLITINSNSTVTLDGAVFIGDALVLNAGDFDMGATGCSAFLITNNTTVNNNVDIISGDLWLTDSTDADTVNTNNCGDVAEVCNGIEFSQTNACFSALPVTFLGLHGELKGDYLTLEWEIIREGKLGHFWIESSQDGVEFIALEPVMPEPTKAWLNRYSKEIRHEHGYPYYRIKHIDHDGVIDYSEVLSVIGVGNDQLKVRVVQEKLHIDVTSEYGVVQLVNLSGTVMYEGQWVKGEEIDLYGLGSGIYIVRFLGTSKNYATQCYIN